MTRSSFTGMKEDDCTAFAHSRIIRCLRVQDPVVPTSCLARYLHRTACPTGSCWPLTFNIRKVPYGFNPFFYRLSREIFMCTSCFSLDTLKIFNYCLFSCCMRVSAETMHRPGERPLGRRALQGARRARAEGGLTCVNVPGPSLTT